MRWLFVPSENYFPSNFEMIKNNLESKLGYQAYIDIFGTLEDITESGASTVDFKGYQIGNLNISQEKFINFSFITKYKDTWYGWVRGVTFVFLVIYNLNQLLKLIRGINLADGHSGNGSNASISGQISMFKEGDKK